MDVEISSFDAIVETLNGVDFEGLTGAAASKKIADVVDGLNDATEASKQFAKANIQVNEAGQLVIPTQQQFSSALQKSSTAMAVATIKATALSIAFNALVTLGIGFIVNGVVTLVDNIIHSEEKLNDKIEESKSAYQERCV